jgi:hypothetical protein
MKGRHGAIMNSYLFLILTIIVCALGVVLFMERTGMMDISSLFNWNRPDDNNGFSDRSVTEVKNAMEYAKDNTVVKRKCDCGNSCNDYAEWVVKYSEENDVPDPLLVVSLIMQESSCRNVGCNELGYCGLMQIDESVAGYENPQTNIKEGVEHLKGKYDTYKNGRYFEGCSKRHVYYDEWEAAMRGYNGWGCNIDYANQDFFVDEIWERYEKLKTVA